MKNKIINNNDSDNSNKNSEGRSIKMSKSLKNGILTGLFVSSLQTSPFAEQYIIYMGNNPAVCGINKTTGKPNSCEKKIPLKEYLRLFPESEEFYNKSHNKSRSSIPSEEVEQRIQKARQWIPAIGSIPTKEELENIQKQFSTISESEIKNVVANYYPGINDEDKKLFIGAARRATWPFLKFHAAIRGLDPRIVYIIAAAESMMYQESGDSGKSKTPMQILSVPGDKNYDTAGKVYQKYKDDPYLANFPKERTREQLMICAIYFIIDSMKAVGIDPTTPLERLTAKQLLDIYHHYNKGDSERNDIVTPQLVNFANRMEKLRFYEDVETFVKLFVKLKKEWLVQYVNKEVTRIEQENKGKIETKVSETKVDVKQVVKKETQTAQVGKQTHNQNKKKIPEKPAPPPSTAGQQKTQKSSPSKNQNSIPTPLTPMQNPSKTEPVIEKNNKPDNKPSNAVVTSTQPVASIPAQIPKTPTTQSKTILVEPLQKTTPKTIETTKNDGKTNNEGVAVKKGKKGETDEKDNKKVKDKGKDEKTSKANSEHEEDEKYSTDEDEIATLEKSVKTLENIKRTLEDLRDLISDSTKNNKKQ